MLVGEEEEDQLTPSIRVLAVAWYHTLTVELDANFGKSLALWWGGCLCAFRDNCHGAARLHDPGKLLLCAWV